MKTQLQNPTATRRAELVEVDQRDGAQCYRYGSGVADVMWLAGVCRASGVTVGDAGVLEYRVTPSAGLWFFVKDNPAA